MSKTIFYLGNLNEGDSLHFEILTVEGQGLFYIYNEDSVFKEFGNVIGEESDH